MVNGIPCKVKTPDEKGNLTNVETFYFATYRKCPELAKYPKEIRSLSNKTAILNRRKEILEEKLAECQGTESENLEFIEIASLNVRKKAIEELLAADNNSKTDELKTALEMVSRKLKEILYAKLTRTEISEFDALQASLDDISAQIEDTSDKIVSLFQEFVSTGLRAAGYDDASVERYAQHITMERFRELLEKSRMGSGMCDFF